MDSGGDPGNQADTAAAGEPLGAGLCGVVIVAAEGTCVLDLAADGVWGRIRDRREGVGCLRDARDEGADKQSEDGGSNGSATLDNGIVNAVDAALGPLSTHRCG